MTALHRLHAEQDQSPWLDFVDRALIREGKLQALVDRGIRGLTSNPTIFAKAVASGQYDELIGRMGAQGASAEGMFEEIAVGDVGDAADILRPLYEASDGIDGYASIEVEPALAEDTQATVERARHLWTRLARPNVYVKIPATEAGIPAIEQAVSEGININITLMFSVDVYRRVAHAYLGGLRARLERGEDISRVSSVASFFVSRVDAKIDKRLDALGTRMARDARGNAAIANAKVAYAAFGEIFGGPEFAQLRRVGARAQRCLWASTSTKDPDYRDVLYVEELIGPETVNTMPLETIEAFIDHGRVARTIDIGLAEARDALRRLEALGISMRAVTDELIDEGIGSFAKSVEELLLTIQKSRDAVASA